MAYIQILQIKYQCNYKKKTPFSNDINYRNQISISEGHGYNKQQNMPRVSLCVMPFVLYEGEEYSKLSLKTNYIYLRLCYPGIKEYYFATFYQCRCERLLKVKKPNHNQTKNPQMA